MSRDPGRSGGLGLASRIVHVSDPDVVGRQIDVHIVHVHDCDVVGCLIDVHIVRVRDLCRSLRDVVAERHASGPCRVVAGQVRLSFDDFVGAAG